MRAFRPATPSAALVTARHPRPVPPAGAAATVAALARSMTIAALSARASTAASVVRRLDREVTP